MPQVKLPNGQLLNFPEGMSQDEMRAAIQKNFPEYALPSNNKTDESIAQEQQGYLASALSGLGQFGAGVLQGAARGGQALGELETAAINKLLGTQLQSPEADIYGALGVQRGTPAKVGEFASEAMLAAPALAVAGPEVLPQMAALGATGAATTPGSMQERLAAALLEGALPGVAKGASKAAGLAKSFPKNVFAESLAKALGDARNSAKEASKQLYDAAFEGTANVKPTLSSKTIDLLSQIKDVDKGAAKAKDALKVFEKKVTPESLHTLRSDLRKLSSSLSDKEMKSGLSGADADLKSLYDNATQALENDLQNTFDKIGGKKYHDYLHAQNHYRENVVPFRSYPSVRKALGPDKEISDRLFTDLSRNAVPAAQLRDLTGTSKPLMLLGKDVIKKPVKEAVKIGGAYEILNRLLDR